MGMLAKQNKYLAVKVQCIVFYVYIECLECAELRYINIIIGYMICLR